MIQKVYDILKPLNIPVQYVLRPDISQSKTGISYHFFNEGYESYGDGKGKEYGGSLQVDIFSTVNYSVTVKQAIQLLEAKGFRLVDSRDSYDNLSASPSIQYYQKISIFNFIESEVK